MPVETRAELLVRIRRHLKRYHDVYLVSQYAVVALFIPTIRSTDCSPSIDFVTRNRKVTGRTGRLREVERRRHVLTVNPARVAAAIELLGRPGVEDLLIVDAEIVDQLPPAIIRVTGFRMSKGHYPRIEERYVVVHFDGMAISGRTSKEARDQADIYGEAGMFDWSTEKFYHEYPGLVVTDMYHNRRGMLIRNGFQLADGEPTRSGGWIRKIFRESQSLMRIGNGWMTGNPMDDAGDLERKYERWMEYETEANRGGDDDPEDMDALAMFGD